jgi:hypothetical protein
LILMRMAPHTSTHHHVRIRDRAAHTPGTPRTPRNGDDVSSGDKDAEDAEFERLEREAIEQE